MHLNWIHIILLLCLAIAATGKAVMDTLNFHFCCCIFTKWTGHRWVDPGISWTNKYKGGDARNGPKFLGSTTVFVFVTDLWHFSDFIFLRFFFAVPIIYSFIHPIVTWWADYLIFSIFFGIVFETIYKLLQKKS